MVMDRIRRLLGRKEIPLEARDMLAQATTPQEMLRGLDELITRNEIEVDRIHKEIEALEVVEGQEKDRVRAGDLAPRQLDEPIELTPEQELIKKKALSKIPAPCCSDNSAYTCCCPCNMAPLLRTHQGEDGHGVEVAVVVRHVNAPLALPRQKPTVASS